MDVFHLTVEEIGELTEAQLAAIYHHPRDDKGNLIRPGQTRTAQERQDAKRDAEPKSLEEALERLDILNRTFRYKPDDYARAREALITKWKQREHGR